MPTQYVVVDGSNIATEARQLPSLAQLESALEELRKDFPDYEVTVVVDATFAHRIDPSELERFEAAQLAGELVSPPAGAIGRGDAFLLRIAEKVDGIVLSNDSFQEFHGEHAWLFERGRLMGATPVPGIGWIFVPRTPVRGPKSRVAVRDASRARERVTDAIAEATLEAEHPEVQRERSTSRSRRSRARTAVTEPPQAVNDPMTFISFIAEHKLGDEIEGEVESFTSHGAVIRYGDVRCYVPLANLGQPPPRSAREVLGRNGHHAFVITALDPYRRGIELALPGAAEISGRPTEETVEAEVRLARRPRPAADGHAERAPEPEEPATPSAGRRRRRGGGGASPAPATADEASRDAARPAAPEGSPPSGKRPGRRTGTVKATALGSADSTPAGRAAASKGPARAELATAASLEQPAAAAGRTRVDAKKAPTKAVASKAVTKRPAPQKAVPSTRPAKAAPRDTSPKTAAVKGAGPKAAAKKDAAKKAAAKSAPKKSPAGVTATISGAAGSLGPAPRTRRAPGEAVSTPPARRRGGGATAAVEPATRPVVRRRRES